MKAHFVGSTTDLDLFAETYEMIIRTIEKSGLSLTSNWLKEARDRGAVSDGKGEWKRIYRENIEAISKADVIIAEVGNKSFFVGFQVALALQKKKPVLLLAQTKRVDSVIGVSLNEEIIRYSQYNDETIEKIIFDFVEENKRGGKDIRFNFFIDRKLLNYLDWKSLQTGEKKAEIIRRLIEEDLSSSD
jgi:hypothetical protein